jgi:hypothetical protein
VFENRVLRKMSGLKRDEVKENWRRLHNEELHDLYSSANIIRVMKKDDTGWAYGTSGGEDRCIQGFGWEI